MKTLLNIDNMEFDGFNVEADLIYCDFIYENLNFDWADKYVNYLKWGGIFIVQTDFHSCAEIWNYLKNNLGLKLVSHSVVKCEWGNHPKRTFHQCFDDVLIFTNDEKEYKFYPERIQVDKVTKSKGLNPSGRQTKTATAWIDDCTLTTTSKERVRKPDNHLLRWQKPLKLYDRIINPFVDAGDLILDPFMGSGSLGLWSQLNAVNYIGIEKDPDVFALAQKNVSPERTEIEYQMEWSL